MLINKIFSLSKFNVGLVQNELLFLKNYLQQQKLKKEAEEIDSVLFLLKGTLQKVHDRVGKVLTDEKTENNLEEAIEFFHNMPSKENLLIWLEELRARRNAEK